MALSYTQLYDLVRRERSHQEIQELPGTFYEEARYLLHELLSASQQGLLFEAEQARVQLVNTRKLLKQLYECREEKTLRLAQSKCKTGSALIDTGKLLSAEKELYDQLVAVLSTQRTQLGVDDFATAAPARTVVREEDSTEQRTIQHETEHASVPKRTSTTNRVIRVIKAVPAFVGTGLETYGPYAENDRVELPETVAQVLIRKGNAQEE